MKSEFESFAEKFRLEDLSIFKSQHWTWSLRPAQPTLGAGIVSLNRYSLTMGEVSSEEMADFSSMVRKVESTVGAAFGHKIMNYLALMMVDHHVHFHVIPRYEEPKEFAGKSWTDNGWPALPAMGDSQHSDDKTLLAIVARLRAACEE